MQAAKGTCSEARHNNLISPASLTYYLFSRLLFSITIGPHQARSKVYHLDCSKDEEDKNITY